jgi:4-hydroxybenzoate polyprenyltransferase
MTSLRPWLELARISNLPTAWTNVLAGWVLAGGGWDLTALGWLLAGASLLYTGGMMLNDAADARFDREYRKERPIPSGRVSAWAVWAVSLGMMAGGAVALAVGAGACPWLVGALVVAILFYDFYHKPWSGSVFVMGSCRTLLVLVAASAVTGGLDPVEDWTVVLRAVALGGYIVGLTLVARNESRRGSAKRWEQGVGWLGLALPVLAGLTILVLYGPGVPLWAVGAAVLALFPVVACVTRAMQIMRTPPPSNIGRSVGLLLAGIVLVDGLAVSLVAPKMALAFLLCFPLLLLWQRKIAAT